MPVNEQIFQLLFQFYANLPHCRALGIRCEGMQADLPVMSVPWRADLVGNRERQTIHGGVITTLVDMVATSAVSAHLAHYESLATLDMRIDYMHPAIPEERIYATAECYRLAGQVAFVRAHCYQHDDQDPIALGTATYMRTPLTEQQQTALRHYLQQEQAS